jgi:hypothetical protein
MQEGVWWLMMANPLLILQHRKIKEKFVLTAPIFDATGNRTAGGVGCAAMQHQNLILILIQETTVL